MTDATLIRQPITLPNGVTLRNRIVKSAMSEALGDNCNNPSDDMIRLFQTWSTSGAAILITGNTPVDRKHLENAGNFSLTESSEMTKVSRLVQAGQSGGAKMLAQLAHAGRQTPVGVNPQPFSVSDVQLDLPGYGKPRMAQEEDLTEIIAKFVRSAQTAETAGFDGVEIHSAHGYLLSSALSPRINTRTDRWGGVSLENRARLPLQVVQAVRAAVRDSFIVAVKLNSSDFQKGGFDHTESVQVAQWLEKEGVDFIEISGGTFEAPTAYQYTTKKQSTVAREAYFLEYAAAIKKAICIPLMVTGGFRSASVMNDAIAAHKTDLIGMGRPFIADPLFPNRLLSGEITRAPAVERELPSADTLPPGAGLNWFCTQLAILGRTGKPELSLPVLKGHEAYLDQIKMATEQLQPNR